MSPVREPDSEAFLEAVGQYRNCLSARDEIEIKKFLSEEHSHAKFFGSDEEKKEYVLHEEADSSFVLRILPDGTWQRVRLRTG